MDANQHAVPLDTSQISTSPKRKLQECSIDLPALREKRRKIVETEGVKSQPSQLDAMSIIHDVPDLAGLFDNHLASEPIVNNSTHLGSEHDVGSNLACEIAQDATCKLSVSSNDVDKELLEPWCAKCGRSATEDMYFQRRRAIKRYLKDAHIPCTWHNISAFKRNNATMSSIYKSPTCTNCHYPFPESPLATFNNSSLQRPRSAKIEEYKKNKEGESDDGPLRMDVFNRSMKKYLADELALEAEMETRLNTINAGIQEITEAQIAMMDEAACKKSKETKPAEASEEVKNVFMDEKFIASVNEINARICKTNTDGRSQESDSLHSTLSSNSHNTSENISFASNDESHASDIARSDSMEIVEQFEIKGFDSLDEFDMDIDEE